MYPSPIGLLFIVKPFVICCYIWNPWLAVIISILLSSTSFGHAVCPYMVHFCNCGTPSWPIGECVVSCGLCWYKLLFVSATCICSILSWLLHGVTLHNLHCHFLLSPMCITNLFICISFQLFKLFTSVYLFISSLVAHPHLSYVNGCCIYSMIRHFLGLLLFVLPLWYFLCSFLFLLRSMRKLGLPCFYFFVEIQMMMSCAVPGPQPRRDNRAIAPPEILKRHVFAC